MAQLSFALKWVLHIKKGCRVGKITPAAYGFQFTGHHKSEILVNPGSLDYTKVECQAETFSSNATCKCPTKIDNISVQLAGVPGGR